MSITCYKYIQKRINIKKKYLTQLIPEKCFVQFLDYLENINTQIEGVTAGQITSECVELEPIKNSFKNLTEYFCACLERINAKREGIKFATKQTLYKEFLYNLKDCKEILIENYYKFEEEIEESAKHVYDLKLLLNITDNLNSVRCYLNVIIKNLCNLEKSILCRNIEEKFTKLCIAVEFSIKTQYNNLLKTLPRIVTSSNLNSNSSQVKMNNENDNCVCEEPSQSNIDDLCHGVGGKKPRLYGQAELAFVEQYEDEFKERRTQLYEVLENLLVSSREITRCDNKLFMLEKQLSADKDALMEAATAKDGLVKDKIDPLERTFQKQKQCIEAEKQKLRDTALVDVREMKKILNRFTTEHSWLLYQLERLKLKVSTSSLDQINEKIHRLGVDFKREIDNIEAFKNKVSNLYIDFDEAVSIGSTTSVSSTSVPSAVAETDAIKCQDRKVMNGEYVKTVIGKALIHGLAAITVTQPTDPIYYLAHYLLHYRHNELSLMQKQFYFEELTAKRDSCQRDMALRNAEAMDICDPCKYYRNSTQHTHNEGTNEG